MADIRHHLKALLAASLVEVVEVRRGGGRGRPVRVYDLSPVLAGDNLEMLAGALLSLWLTGDGGEQDQARLNALAQRLLEQGGETLPGVSLSLRLKYAVERLNELHYQARWEASAQGPRLLLGRCPYRDLAESHPELCRLDALLIARLTGHPSEHLVRRTAPGGGLPVCIFRVALTPLEKSA